MAKGRSIFEEVGEKRVEAPVTVRRRVYARRGIAIWIGILFVMVVAMIVVGGLTRLTGSGLSITEWRPVTGALPPLTLEDWEREFALYRQIPQYERVNQGMSLAEFQVIYWWEWGHRQLGRVIGLVWAVGFAGFLIARKVPPGWTGRLLLLGVLGGLQGAIGWWMVASGLEGEMVRVASYRLAAHLGLAFAILGLIAWYMLALRREEGELLQARRRRNPRLMRWGDVLVWVGFVQILLGALVAGIDAGRGYIDWPLMGGQFVPPAPFALEPLWTNFFENPGLVQFNHRMVGYLLVILGGIAWWRSRGVAGRAIRRGFDAMAIALLAQLVLGIATVVHAAPWQIAILHQVGAVVLFVLMIRARFLAQFPPEERIARA
ncbi:MAG TPA: heme A synthase [Paracoccaceae bacterium]|nr:heme A synthase [Paracoccaceae bacterium]